MDLWKFVMPERGVVPCDSISPAHPQLLSGGSVEAVLLDSNPLAESGAALLMEISAPVVVLRSGRIEPSSGDETDRVDAARRTWTGEGRARFERVWAELETEAERRGLRLWLHPRAGDVIGDVPGLRWIMERGGIGLMLEPSALLTPEMVADAGDHFRRITEPLETAGVVRAVVVTNIDDRQARVPIDAGAGAGAGAGLIDPAVLWSLARRVGRWAPVCVLAGDAKGLVENQKEA